MRLRRQYRWWRPGGFRDDRLARLTHGRVGLGRWTQGEVDRINAEVDDMVRVFGIYEPRRTPPLRAGRPR